MTNKEAKDILRLQLIVNVLFIIICLKYFDSGILPQWLMFSIILYYIALGLFNLNKLLKK